MLKLDKRDFEQIRDLIREKSGMFFDEKKLYFVEKRVEARMREGAFPSFRDYYRSLRYDDNRAEMANLLEALTTNETYFYRHIPQLEGFRDEALPLVLEQKRKAGDNRLGVWSAASSTGEEIYTLGIMIREKVPDLQRWKVDLLATDLDRVVLQRARQAVYDQRSVKDVPPDLLKRHFSPLDDGRWQLGPAVRNMVRFEQVNLIDEDAMREKRGMDLIFCRNVLIYFDEESRRKVVNLLYDALNPGGFIFLGHSESVGRLSAAFKLVKFQRTLAYQK